MPDTARAVVFDLDGTLVETAADIHAVLAEVLAEAGLVGAGSARRPRHDRRRCQGADRAGARRDRPSRPTQRQRRHAARPVPRALRRGPLPAQRALSRRPRAPGRAARGRLAARPVHQQAAGATAGPAPGAGARRRLRRRGRRRSPARASASRIPAISRRCWPRSARAAGGRGHGRRQPQRPAHRPWRWACPASWSASATRPCRRASWAPITSSTTWPTCPRLWRA